MPAFLRAIALPLRLRFKACHDGAAHDWRVWNNPCRECYGIVDVYPDLLRINGVDTFASEEWRLPPLPPGQPPSGKVAVGAMAPAGAAAAAGQQPENVG
jgi:hypothetical protein